MAIDREKILTAAQKLVEKRKYDKAVIEYQKIVQDDPNDARTLLKIGDLQSKMETYGDAIATYERVGKFYAQQGFGQKAIAVYTQIRDLIAKHVPQLEERYAHVTPKLADLYQQHGQTSDAITMLDEIATRHQRQGREPDAIDILRQIVALSPSNPLPHLRLAETLSRGKDVDGAVSEFAVAASQLLKLGRRDDGIKVLERLLHHKADAAHARIAAELYLARGQQNDGMQALAKLQICFQSNPKDLDTLSLLARAFSAIGQAGKGIEVQKEMARIAREQGKTELFKQIVERLLRAAPNDPGVRQLLEPTSTSATGPQAVENPAKAYPARAPSPPQRTYEVDDDEAEEEDAEPLDELSYEDSEQEEPFEMRPSSPPMPSAEALPPDELAADEEELLESGHLEAISEAPPELDPSAYIADLMHKADGFRMQRQFGRAAQTIRFGLQTYPRSVELHVGLRDTLIEAGEYDEAVEEMMKLASLQVDALDGEGAAVTLQEILSIDPTNPQAIGLLRELGYEIVEEQPPSIMGDSPDLVETLDPTQLPVRPVSLPSYELEDVHAKRPSTRAPFSGRVTDDPLEHPLEEIDDPFRDGPLPSFPLESPLPGPEFAEEEPTWNPADDSLVAAPDGTDASMALPPMDGDTYSAEAAAHETSGLPFTVPPAATASPLAMAELEEALEEADFFVSRGLFEDARAILDEQLTRAPNHPLIVERMAELEMQLRTAANGSGPRSVPRAESSNDLSDVDRAFDIAESLGGGDDGEHALESGPLGGFGGASEQVDVEEVFAKFKEGVAKQISVDDAQSHYDLGVAYKEMGLIEDAINEFVTAARDPKRECVCLSMIGGIELERGNVDTAIDAFARGVRAEVRTEEQETVLCYELGSAYEQKRMAKEALAYFHRVLRRDPTFRNVQERIKRLSRPEAAPKPRAAAVGADDDFDRAFADMFSKK